MALSQWLNSYWYRPFSYLHWPFYALSCLYQVVLDLRSLVLRRCLQWKPPVPLLVVGNITVGGVGKTPLVIEIAKYYTHLGYRVGIVSRGYRAKIKLYPYEVNLNDDPHMVGDEPYLIHINTNCPVVIAPNRVHAVQFLLERHKLDLIISDDGLQHESLGRHVELVVVDGSRGFGNYCLLPWGPLRESVSRLKNVDAIIINHSDANNISSQDSQQLLDNIQLDNTAVYNMHTQFQGFRDLKTNNIISLDEIIKQQPLLAIGGIGNPERFFQNLRSLGVSIKSRAFPDHHAFSASDWSDWDGAVIMTEKDAVKCRDIMNQAAYYLQIQARLPSVFWLDLSKKLNLIKLETQELVENN